MSPACARSWCFPPSGTTDNIAPAMPIPDSQSLKPVANDAVREAAGPFFDDLAQRASGGEGEGAAMLLARLREDARAEGLANAIFFEAPFLREAMLRDPAFAADALAGDPARTLDAIIAELGRTLGETEGEQEAKTALRRARYRAALAIALADLSGAWSVEQVTEGLSAFADAALGGTVDWLLRAAYRKAHLEGFDAASPGRGSGYIVLAMGKYGARELNYSSDIDLMVFYDPEVAPLADGVEASTFFVRLTRRLVSFLQDITADGYVFRVDLRLRPDPRATNIAIAVEAAAQYYESMGQNWERAAMIKARPVAGDMAAGADFLDRLPPFVWRKYLDFAAILDVQSLKRQIHSVKGHGTVAVRGHNLKLGRGGIREIEFFVQTQQLIAGGRMPELRGRQTLEMLDALAEADWITPDVADELKDAYRVLRTVEHRLQMMNDEQTHTLPSDDEAFARFALFAGFETPEALEAALEPVLRTVERHYSALFEQSAGLGVDAGNLVFTGGEDDPGTLEALSQLGFAKVSEISAAIRGWHFGRFPATRSARARERLTEIMPALLTALSRAGEPDSAFFAFDRFLTGLPAGVQLFSLLWANPKLLDLVATLMGTAPRLADQVSHRPRIFDAVLDPGFFGPLPGREELHAAVDEALAGEQTFEENLDRARVVGHEQMFRIGVRVLTDTVSAAEAGRAYTALADVLSARLLKACQADFAEAHGHVPGGEAVLVAMGKWGGREMTASSDLDLILIYETAEADAMSDGAKPLMAGQYYARLTKRLVSALSAPTAEGVLYEVDMRLRPSGNAGPLATHISSFVAYHQGSAWTWERMALTRARVVAGDGPLARTVEDAIVEALRQPRDVAALAADAVDMRRRLLSEFGGRGLWDLKHTRGGLIDIEFIAQFLQVANAATHERILDQTTHEALGHLAAEGLIASAEAHALRDANSLYHRLIQVIRLCVADRFEPDRAPEGLKRLLAQAGDAPDLGALEARLAETQTQVAGLFDKIVGPL